MEKIAFFLPSMRGGGAERVMATLASEFAGRGYDVDIVLAKAEGPYLEEISSRIRIVDLKKKRVAYTLWPLIKYMRNEKPTAIFSTLDNANVIAVIAKILSATSVRVIVRQANNIFFIQKKISSDFKIKDWVLRILVKITYPLADCIVAVSHGVARDLINTLKIDGRNINVIYNPVLLENIFIKAAEIVDHPWFGEGNDPIILGIGSLSKQKDFSTLINAVSIVKKNIPVKLIILGEGEERPALERLVEKNNMCDIVSMPGFVKNPFPYIKQARLFVLSSIFEGLPNVLIQALVLGVRVISTDCHSGPREILECGRLGRLVSVRDVKMLANEILDDLKNNNKINVDNAEILARFDSGIIADQYLKLL